MVKIVTVTMLALFLVVSLAPPAQALDAYFTVDQFLNVPIDDARAYLKGVMDGVFLFLDRVYGATWYCPSGFNGGLNSETLLWTTAGKMLALPVADWKVYAASPFVIGGVYDMGCYIVQK